MQWTRGSMPAGDKSKPAGDKREWPYTLSRAGTDAWQAPAVAPLSVNRAVSGAVAQSKMSNRSENFLFFL